MSGAAQTPDRTCGLAHLDWLLCSGVCSSLKVGCLTRAILKMVLTGQNLPQGPSFELLHDMHACSEQSGWFRLLRLSFTIGTT